MNEHKLTNCAYLQEKRTLVVVFLPTKNTSA
jgi:hypothetical protein